MVVLFLQCFFQVKTLYKWLWIVIPVKGYIVCLWKIIIFSQLESNGMIFNIKKQFFQNGLRNHFDYYADHPTERKSLSWCSEHTIQSKAENFHYYYINIQDFSPSLPLAIISLYRFYFLLFFFCPGCKLQFNIQCIPNRTIGNTISAYLALVCLFIYLFILFIYFWLHWVSIAAHGLSLVAASGGYSSLRCTGFFLIAVASLVVEHRLQAHGLQQLQHVGSVVAARGPQSTRASVVVAHGLSCCGSWALERRLSSCGARAQLLRGMWDLPGPGLQPVSPALAGGFLTTAPPGKLSPQSFLMIFLMLFWNLFFYLILSFIFQLSIFLL